MRRLIGRTGTVRARIVALALAPVLALLVLWGFAMVSVTGELRSLVRVQGVYEEFGTPSTRRSGRSRSNGGSRRRTWARAAVRRPSSI